MSQEGGGQLRCKSTLDNREVDKSFWGHAFEA
jgi:hypothetical protein